MKPYLKYIIVLSTLFCFSGALAQVNVSGKLYSVDECIELANKKEQDKDYREASNFLNGAAFYVWEEKKYDDAIDYFTQSISLNQKLNNTTGIAGIYSNIGMIYNDKREYQKSYDNFIKTLEIREKQKEKVPLIKTQVNLSVVLNNLQRYDESIDYLNRALKLAGEIGDRDQIKSCYGMLAETYEKKGDHKSSMQYFEYYKASHEDAQREKVARTEAALQKVRLNLDLTEAEKSEKTVQLALKERQLSDKQQELSSIDSVNKTLIMRANEADLRIKLLEKEEAINELQRQKIEHKLKERQVTTLLVSTLLTVTLIFLIILYGSLRNKKRLNKLLTERNEIIVRQKMKLEDENQVRTKLLSIISHDLRTPLSTVHLLVQILRSNTLSPEMVDKHLRKLEESLNSSFQMLDNMLYWAKSQINGISNRPETIDAKESIDTCLRILSSNIQNKNIQINNNLTNLLYIYADKEMINIIFRNILSNAIKFTPEAGKITLDSKTEQNKVIISIADTGTGISKEQQKNIFTNSINSNSGTAKETGSGLGLVLVHDFVKACKGTITFTSEENKGTTFFITFILANQQQIAAKK